MATTRQQNRTAYGLSDPLLGVPSFPIIAKRAPTSSDKALVGTMWVDTVGLAAYVLVSTAGGTSNWLDTGGGSGVFTSITVTPGNITATLGNIIASVGDIDAIAGNINAGATITAGTGITSTTGNISASAGNVTAGAAIIATTTVTGTTGVTATSGNVTASSGNVVATLGNVTALSGNVTALTIYASGDSGGVASQNALTNAVNITQGAGVGTVLLTGATSRNNTGFIKMYVGATAVFVPYFANIT